MQAVDTKVKQSASPMNRESNEAFKSWFWPLAIVVYFLINIVVISPVGNFPLNDDWVYGHGVKSLLQTGRIELPTSFSTAFVHVGLGALACCTGFSYTSLHLAVAFMGLVSGLALFLALRELNVRRNIAGFAALLYVSNPLIVNLCFSFMSDIPSFAFTNLYLLFLFRGIKRDSTPDYLISSLMLIAAAGVRQGTLLYVAANAFVIALSFARSGLTKKNLLLPLLLIVMPIAITSGMESYLEHGATKCAEYTTFKQAHLKFVSDFFHVPFKWFYSMTVALGQVTCYYAIFALPLLLLFVPKLMAFARQKMSLFFVWASLASAVVATTLTKLVAVDGRLMPFNQNVLHIPEVGAHNLLGICLPAVSKGIRVWMTHLSGLLSVFLLVVIGSSIERVVVLVKRAFPLSTLFRDDSKSSFKQRRAIGAVFVFVSLILCLGAVSMETIIMDADRHYMIAFAPVLIAICFATRWWGVKKPGIVALALLLAMAVYSTLATQDYMSWNRARWQAIGKLEKSGIDCNEIDGGPEYVFANDPNLALKTWRNEARQSLRDYWRWWRVNGDEYIVSFSPVPCYQEISREDYFGALTMSKRSILVLKRAVADQPYKDPETGKMIYPKQSHATQAEKVSGK